MIKKIVHFFDKLEDIVRGELSRAPIIYAFVAGIGVVLFWRGVWHIADQIPYFNGTLSFFVGSIILLMTGVFVSSFVGNRLIISGLTQSKKLTDKSSQEIEEEIAAEEHNLDSIKKTLQKIEQDIEHLR